MVIVVVWWQEAKMKERWGPEMFTFHALKLSRSVSRERERERCTRHVESRDRKPCDYLVII